MGTPFLCQMICISACLILLYSSLNLDGSLSLIFRDCLVHNLFFLLISASASLILRARILCSSLLILLQAPGLYPLPRAFTSLWILLARNPISGVASLFLWRNSRKFLCFVSVVTEDPRDTSRSKSLCSILGLSWEHFSTKA